MTNIVECVNMLTSSLRDHFSKLISNGTEESTVQKKFQTRVWSSNLENFKRQLEQSKIKLRRTENQLKKLMQRGSDDMTNPEKKMIGSAAENQMDIEDEVATSTTTETKTCSTYTRSATSATFEETTTTITSIKRPLTISETTEALEEEKEDLSQLIERLKNMINEIGNKIKQEAIHEKITKPPFCVETHLIMQEKREREIKEVMDAFHSSQSNKSDFLTSQHVKHKLRLLLNLNDAVKTKIIKLLERDEKPIPPFLKPTVTSYSVLMLDAEHDVQPHSTPSELETFREQLAQLQSDVELSVSKHEIEVHQCHLFSLKQFLQRLDATRDAFESVKLFIDVQDLLILKMKAFFDEEQAFHDELSRNVKHQFLEGLGERPTCAVGLIPSTVYERLLKAVRSVSPKTKCNAILRQAGISSEPTTSTTGKPRVKKTYSDKEAQTVPLTSCTSLEVNLGCIRPLTNLYVGKCSELAVEKTTAMEVEDKLTATKLALQLEVLKRAEAEKLTIELQAERIRVTESEATEKEKLLEKIDSLEKDMAAATEKFATELSNLETELSETKTKLNNNTGDTGTNVGNSRPSDSLEELAIKYSEEYKNSDREPSTHVCKKFIKPENPLKCGLCLERNKAAGKETMAFTRADHLYRHIRFHHLDFKKQCPKCNKLMDPHNLERHLITCKGKKKPN